MHTKLCPSDELCDDSWNSLVCPPWSKVARGFSHCILFSRCWIHFRTIFLSQTWNVKSNSAPPTDLHVLASGGAGIPTELIFSLLLRKKFFICSESHWMLSVAVWLHNSWSYCLPRICHRIIRKQKLEDLSRCEHKFPSFTLTCSDHLLKQVSLSPAKVLHKWMWCAKLRATHLYLRGKRALGEVPGS